MEPRPVPDPVPPSRAWWWIFDPRASLRTRAALFFGVGALLFTVLVSTIAGQILRQSLEHQLSGSFETLAFQVSDKIDRLIYERYRALEMAANLPAIRDADTSPAERRRMLAALLDTWPEFAWLGVVDASGRIVAATGGEFENRSVSDRTWFNGAREHAFVGGPHEMAELARALDNADTSIRFLDLAVPLTGPNGRFAGVLAAHLRWNWTRDVQLSVVPDSARLEALGVTVYAADGDVLLDTGVSGWTHPPAVSTIPNGRLTRGALLEDTAEGSHYLTGYARSRGFREYRGIGWVTTVRQPVVRAFAPVAHLQRTLLGWGIFFSMVVAVASWVTAGKMARRLRSITAAADRIRSGDILTVLPQPHDESEMAAMCGALGNMVENFRAQQTALETHPQERDAAKR